MGKNKPQSSKKSATKPFLGFNQPYYTQIPDELFDELLSGLSGAELKVLLYVMRRTFGFKKDSDNISLSQICRGIKTKDGRQLDKGTGLDRKTVIRAAKSLEQKGIIISSRNPSIKGDYDATTYRPNILEAQKQHPSKETTEGSGKIPLGGSGKIRPPYTRDSSTRNRLKNSNSKTLEKSETPEPRTNGMRRVGELLTPLAIMVKKRAVGVTGEPVAGENNADDGNLTEKKAPQQDPPQPPTDEINERLDWLGKKVSFDVGDTAHTRENTKQVKNIYREQLAQGIGHGILSFTEVALTTIGLTREIQTEKPGAYFFKTFRNRVGLLESG